MLLEVVLTDAPLGLSGFGIIVNVVDDGVAKIVDVTYPIVTFPIDFGLTFVSPAMPSLAGEKQVELRAVDINLEVQGGSSDIILARIELNGISQGTTEIEIIAGSLGMDDDSGDEVLPDFVDGTLVIN